MTPAKLGIDIIEIERIDALIQKEGQRFLDRLFSQEEQEYCQRKSKPAPHYAARFAAKEAVIKALEVRDIALKDIVVTKKESGAVGIELRDQRFEGVEFSLSITHSRDYAAAVVQAFG